MAYGLPVSGAGVTNYIDRHVNPDSAYLALCGEFTNDIVKFMHEVTPYSVATTIKVEMWSLILYLYQTCYLNVF